MKHVGGVLYAKIHRMGRIGIPSPTHVAHIILDAGIPDEGGVGILRCTQLVGIVRIHGGGIEEEFGANQPVPPQGACPVSPSKIKQIGGAKLVSSKVGTDKHAVLFTQFGIDLDIEVIKVDGRVVELG